MKKVFFGLIATIMFSVSGFASNVANGTITKKEITSFTIDGKSYSPAEFSALSPEFLKEAAPCTVTVKITVQTPIGPVTFNDEITFDASWWGCLLAKVAAFLASIWTPSI
jgi:hypothetical protein